MIYDFAFQGAVLSLREKRSKQIAEVRGAGTATGQQAKARGALQISDSEDRAASLSARRP